MEQTTRLGERIRQRRREVGMTAARLAAAVGVTENAIRKLESGDSAEPRFTTGVKIAEALEMPPEALARGRMLSPVAAPELAKVITAIRSVRTSLEDEGIEHVDIFGSVARGDANTNSDVDLVVTPREGAHFSLFNLGAAGNTLEDVLGRKVDVVTRHGAENSKRISKALESSVRAFQTVLRNYIDSRWVLAGMNIPPNAVVRVSHGDFDPARYADVENMARDTGEYLIPAIKKLSGLISYAVGVSPSGSIVHASIWESNEHAQQMSTLKEMIVDATQAAIAAGVVFIPKVDYPIVWSI